MRGTAHIAHITLARIAARDVGAMCIGTAWVLQTFVQVPALGSHGFEPWTTRALSVGAAAVVHAVEVGVARDANVELINKFY